MRPGMRLGDRFELEQQIGSGGMGRVFRAHDPISSEPVAVKVIAGEHGHHTERFAREIKVLAELSHPGIVRYISHGVTPSGEPFLVMEWLDGDLLKTRLQRGPLPASEAVLLAPRGSIPWAQGLFAYHMGLMMTGRIAEFLASRAAPGGHPCPRGRGVDVAGLPHRGVHPRYHRARRAGHRARGAFRALVRARGDQEPLARLWWHYAVGLRAA